ncbi:hypothetical protein AO385_1719 [Moraxella catarrhalis]|uniref:Uncharacterized protein n=1 Tax=Moraxella catarrhalis TaxID=480 RepID=A0A198UL97_MORCA|nr:hypothetical protein AO383_1975 [Moraxella catarrhalis]OAU97146.1 hypothetical protein AO384_0743 [Moraxella catarrhalis]OAU97503.1 hypothetical protein AO385_1719 [Moraxella catarrhalis]OAV00760.1 hypothetical protein AO381_1851 [Moraxella catarrhalis]OAV12142.1 hypothetical protein AO378_0014 [Moraxella catarrhalis]
MHGVGVMVWMVTPFLVAILAMQTVKFSLLVNYLIPTD